jgi:tetratricopeptide (TPR) repeat protein
LTPRQTSDVGARAALIHRENLQIGALILIAIAAFFATRAVAASNRRMSLRDAAEWHRRGQEALAAGRVDEAVDDLRRATIRNRQETPYVLTLARALQLRHDNDEARRVLLTLRESAPEDAEVNLELARLGAARHDVTEAIRFYHNALYAVWPAGQEEARRRVRLELIRFLLAQDQTGRALVGCDQS